MSNFRLELKSKIEDWTNLAALFGAYLEKTVFDIAIAFAFISTRVQFAPQRANETVFSPVPAPKSIKSAP